MLHPRIEKAYRPVGRFASTAGAVPRIQALIREGALDPYVRSWALRALREADVEGRDDVGEVSAILDFVQDSFPYRSDVLGVETLHSAKALLRMLEAGAPGADCDDMTILLGALLESVGHPVRIAITRLRPGAQWGHIYPEAWIKSRSEWLPLDATNPTAALGWESEDYVQKRRFSMNRVYDALDGTLDTVLDKAEGILGQGRQVGQKLGLLKGKKKAGKMLAEAGVAPIPQKSGMSPLLLVGLAAVGFFLLRGRR